MENRNVFRIIRRMVFALAGVLSISFTAHAALIPILECPGTGTGGDRADLRGIRFTVSQSFSAVEVRMDANIAGTFTFDAELRRSTGFITTPDAIATGVSVTVPGSTSTTPYQPVVIEFGNVSVTGDETFTLKFTNISGTGTLFFETFGIGNEPCPDVEETDQNNVAVPTVRGDPAGFKVLTEVFSIIASYATTAPAIDGQVGFGEWEIGNQIPLDNGFITVRNDQHRLYILVDLLADTGDDVAPSPDYFWLTFDVNADAEITPGVDLNYATAPSTGNMRYQFYLGPGSWTGLQPDTFSAKGRGFGCFFADGSLTVNFFPFSLNCSAHRVWEFGIDLAEIGAQAGDTVSMGLRVSSPNPPFTEDVPTNFFTDFTNLIQVQLAPPVGLIPAPNVAASVDLEVDAFEVTQGVQTRTNSLSLVADKSTVARVYAETNNLFTPQPSIVSLYGSKGGVDLPGSPLAQFFVAPTTIDREEIGDTANFPLPNTWDDGTIQFRAVVRDLFENESASAPVALPFTAKEKPTYWTVPINTGTTTSPVLPSDAEIASQENYTETVFPVADITFVRKPWEAIGPTTVSNTIAELNDYFGQAVLAWVLGVLFTGEAPFDLPDQIYGFTPSGGGISDPVWFGGNGWVARGFRGSSREGTMAHEINHNLDRDPSGTWGRHVPFGCGAGGTDPNWPFTNDDIQEVGFDPRLPWVDGTGTRDTVIPSNYPDFMSYCQSEDLPGNPAGQLPTKWVSTYRWQNLFNNFSTLLTPSLRLEALALEQQKIQEVYYIAGQVNIDGTGSLGNVLVQPGVVTEEVLPGDYAIQVLDVTGRVVLELPFFASFVDVEGERRETVPFSFFLPAVQQPAAIQLTLRGQVLDTIKVSANAPEVQVLVPNGGERWTGLQTIQWAARDADGDPLTFSILYTPDDGRTWVPVASNLRGDSFEVDTSLLPGGQAARVRVIVTDGFNTTEDDSDNPFFVLPNPPQVVIKAPDSGAQFVSGEIIQFVGDATDNEDASIPDERFVWSHDGTVFGTGRQVDAALPDGSHEVTLTVVDSDDLEGTASIKVAVLRDSDNDGLADIEDNCILDANADQRDTDQDGYGNICDPDLDNNGIVQAADLALFKPLFFTADADADFNGDGIVNAADLAIMKTMFFGPPGPSCCGVLP